MSRLWRQLGADISGEAAGDYSGYSIAMSEDGSQMAIGAIYTDDGSATDSGYVQVYQLNGETEEWDSVGDPIRGDVSGDYAGFSVAMSADASRVAVSAPFSNTYGLNAGLVRIYDRNSGWAQIGPDISGANAGDQAGFSITMNGAGNRIAVGAIYNDNASGQDAGHVRIFQEGEGSWDLVGAPIIGEFASDYAGFSVAMNSAGNRLAIGATYNGGGAGHVRIYDLSGGVEWVLAQEYTGPEDSMFGYSVAFNEAGTVLAVGAPRAATKGQVFLYGYAANTWAPVTADLNGVEYGDMYGRSVKLDAAGTRLVVGAPGSDVTADDDKGRVYVYEKNGAAWALMSQSWAGRSSGDKEGYSLAIAGDRVAIGSIEANAKAGRTRVYQLKSNVATLTINSVKAIINATASGDITAVNGVYKTSGAVTDFVVDYTAGDSAASVSVVKSYTVGAIAKRITYTITITVTSEDGENTAEEVINVYVKSSDTALNSITVNDSTKTTFTDISVNALNTLFGTNDSGGTVSVSPAVSTAAAGQTTTFTFTVTAEDGVTQGTHTVAIYVKSAIADLSSATFGSTVLEGDGYLGWGRVHVPSGSDSITPTVVLKDSKASWSIDDNTDLEYGSNTATITVTAENGSTNYYTVELYRYSGSTNINGARLLGVFEEADITVSGETEELLIEGTPQTVLVKNSFVGGDISDGAFEVDLEYPDLQAFDVSYNYDLDLGDNDVQIIVTAEDPAIPPYIHLVKVRVAKADVDISSSYVPGGQITYVDGSASIIVSGEFSITSVPKDADATIVATIGDEQQDGPITSLPDGSSDIVYVVTAEDTSISATYTLKVYKKSNDTSIASMVLNGITYDGEEDSVVPDLNGEGQSATVYVSAGTELANISVVPNQAAATVVDIFKPTNLKGGANTVTIHIRAEDDTVRIYTLLVTVQSDDVRLASATARGTVYDGQSIVGQKISLPAGTQSIAVSGVAKASTAAVSIRGDSGLQTGDNTVTITVTAEDGTYAPYSFNAYVLSNDTSLVGLTVNSASHAGEARANGRVEVGYDSVSPAIVPTAAAKASASISGGSSLEVGNNTVTVTVTAEDGTQKTYSFTIYRKSNDTALSGFTLDIRGIRRNFDISGSSIAPMAVSRYADISATPVDPKAIVDSITPSGRIGVSGDVTIVVRAEDRSKSKTYTLPIEILSADTSLLSVLVDGSGLNVVAVGDGEASYTIRYAPTSVQVDISANHPDASVHDLYGTDGLQIGDNDVSFNVVAANLYDTQPYTLKIHRMSNDASLTAIDVSGAFGPVDLSGTTFTLRNPVKFATTSLLLTPRTAHPLAVSPAFTPALSLGWNTITVNVTAEDDTYSQTYTFRVYRQNNVATLASLRVTDGRSTMSSFPMPLSTVNISNFVRQITDVSGALTDPKASVVWLKPTVTATADYVVARVTSEDASVVAEYNVHLDVLSNDTSLRVASIDGIDILSGGDVVLPYTKNNGASPASLMTVHTSDSRASVSISGANLSTTSNPITIRVTAEDGSVQNHTFRARVKSNACSITGVSINGTSIWDGSNLANQVVASSVSSATIAVTHTGVSVSGAGSVSLNFKANSFTITVTAEDPAFQTSKSFQIYRKSNETGISWLKVNNHTFSIVETIETIFQGPQISRPIDISYNLADSAATLAITPYAPVDGTNTVTFTVTAEDSLVTRSYTLQYYLKSDKKALTSLTVGGITKDYDVDANTQFDLPYGTVATVMSGVYSDLATINFPQVALVAEQATPITATVVAEDGTTAAYPFKVYVKSGNPNLVSNPSWLSTSPAVVGYDVSSIAITATPQYNRATVTYNGVANPVVPLIVGDNSITVVVTAEDTRYTRTYGPYTIRRQSNNVELAGVFVAPEVEYSWSGSVYQGAAVRVRDLSFDFITAELAATAELQGVEVWASGQTYTKNILVTAEDRSKTRSYPITFRTLSADTSATVLLDGVAAANKVVPYNTTGAVFAVQSSAALSSVIVNGESILGQSVTKPLAVGDNTFTITITAEDGDTTRSVSYTIRRRSDDVTISALTLGGVSLIPSAVMEGTASVTLPSRSASATVAPVATHPNAVITNINGHLQLSPGDNDVRFTVRAEDGNTQEYVVNVRRAGSNTRLAEVTVNDIPVSIRSITSGTAYVKTKRPLSIYAEPQDSYATYAVIQPASLVDGSGNIVVIKVRAEDRDISANYSIRVDLLSNVTALSAFQVNGAPVSHGTVFQAAPGTSSVRVDATSAHPAATLTIAGHQQLRAGENAVAVTVTAEDGTVQVHQITVFVGESSQGPTAPLTYTDDQDRIDRRAGSYILSTYRRWNRVADYETYMRMKRFLNR